ncbi:hypothetical protein D3C77_355000 [compost metagenome]
MKRFIAVFALSVLAAAVQADTYPSGSVQMMILSATPQRTDGDPAQLQETAGQKCRYAGRLTRGEQIDKTAHQILSLKDSNRYHWSITIDRQICPEGLVREVHLVAPLSIVAGVDDFKAGTKVLAVPEKG